MILKRKRQPEPQLDGRAMTRQALRGNPALLAEMERGWIREDAMPKTYEEWRRFLDLPEEDQAS